MIYIWEISHVTDSMPLCVTVGKADLLSDHFDNKQSRLSVDVPPIFHRSSSLAASVFRSSDFKRLLLDLYPYYGTNPLNIYFFLKRTADVLPPFFDCGGFFRVSFSTV